MSVVRTKEQIDDEIARLKAIKPKVPQSNFWGENPQEQVEAQIQVLEERMDDDAVEAKWPPEEEEVLFDMAMEARNWLIGDYADGPAKGWEESFG